MEARLLNSVDSRTISDCDILHCVSLTTSLSMAVEKYIRDNARNVFMNLLYFE